MLLSVPIRCRIGGHLTCMFLCTILTYPALLIRLPVPVRLSGPLPPVLLVIGQGFVNIL